MNKKTTSRPTLSEPKRETDVLNCGKVDVCFGGGVDSIILWGRVICRREAKKGWEKGQLPGRGKRPDDLMDKGRERVVTAGGGRPF